MIKFNFKLYLHQTYKLYNHLQTYPKNLLITFKTFKSMQFQQWSFEQHFYSLIHYKNSMFHGEIKSHMKENAGILILDNGEVVIGNFKNDQLHGDSIVFINSETYVIGSFSRGMLDGVFLLRNPNMAIYWTTKMNKIQGQIIVINYESMVARNWVIENGQGYCTNQISLVEMDKEKDILNKLSPGMLPFGTVMEFLHQRFGQSLKVESSSLTQTCQVSLPTNSHHKLRVVIFKDKLIEYGVYHRDQLNGLGYLVEGANVMQGRFKNGKLDGNGLKMDIQMEKIIYGAFMNGDIRTIDIITDNQETARKELKQYKKQQHIYSLEYQNNYFNERPILMLVNFLKTIQENDENFTKEYQYQEEIVDRKEKSFEKSALLTSGKVNLGTVRKDSGNNENQETFTSRFKKSLNATNSKNTGVDKKKQGMNESSQFLEGINEFNRINKALRKYK